MPPQATLLLKPYLTEMKKAQDQRRNRMAKRYAVRDFLGHRIAVPVFDDLEDHELQLHLTMALRQDDFEYCSHVMTEAESRGLKLNIRLI